MASRFVSPDTTRIEISNGDWLLVKRRLTQGETAEAFERRLTPTAEGWRIHPLMTGLVQVTAYLLDWSLPEYPIRGKSVDEVTTALKQLDPDDFIEIREAIQAHEQAVQAERDREKKTRSASNGAAASSPSPSAADGVSSGSVN